MTWSNAPAVGGVISSFSTPAILGTWREADVMSAVTGNGYVDFYVVTPSDNGVDYLSKEGGVNSPTLTVQWSKPETSPTPTGSITLEPAATPTPVPTPTPAPTPMPVDGSFKPETPTTAEWGEGTNIEPAAEFGTTYAGGSTPTATSTPTPSSTLMPTPSPTLTPTPSPTPAPTPAPSGDPILVGAGDIASCSSSGDEATAGLLDAIPGTVFTAGDNSNDEGTADQFLSCYEPTWGRHKARTRPSPGNHDYLTPSASGYFGYFGAAAGDPSKGYYSYDLGAWHVVVLNGNCSKVGGCGAGSAQEQWLRADLAAHPAVCTLAYWHQPLFSSGGHGGDSAFRAFWQALYDYGADVVVNGHDHDYERFASQDPNGTLDWAKGIRQFVVGTGGKSHSAVGSAVANSEVRNSDTFGVLKLTLHSNGYDWEFVPQAGKTFTDSGSQSCH